MSNFADILAECGVLHEAKDHDYGSAWKYLPWHTIIYIVFYKAFRVRVLLEKQGRVPEKIKDTLYDIINWSVFALIQIENENNKDVDVS